MQCEWVCAAQHELRHGAVHGGGICLNHVDVERNEVCRAVAVRKAHKRNVRDLGGRRHNNHWRICLKLCEWRGRLPSALSADGSARLAIPTHSLSGFFNIRHRDVNTAAIAYGVTKAVYSAIETSQSLTAAGVTPWRQLLDASESYPWPQLR